MVRKSFFVFAVVGPLIVALAGLGIGLRNKIRISATTIKRFDEIYEFLPTGCLLEKGKAPEHWTRQWDRSDARRF